MGYGSSSYGSSPLGGAAAPLNLSLEVSTQTTTLSLGVPALVIKNRPASFSISLSLHAPSILIPVIFVADTQALTLSQQEPAVEFSVPAATLSMSISIETPVVKVSISPRSIAGPFHMGVYAGFAPKIGSLAPRIVRYIKDPIVTGGCPQCGTYLYENNGLPVDSDIVNFGRNPDLGPVRDDMYVRCGRCGWVLNKMEHDGKRVGSRVGWGVKYSEVEAGSE